MAVSYADLGDVSSSNDSNCPIFKSNSILKLANLGSGVGLNTDSGVGLNTDSGVGLITSRIIPIIRPIHLIHPNPKKKEIDSSKYALKSIEGAIDGAIETVGTVVDAIVDAILVDDTRSLFADLSGEFPSLSSSCVFFKMSLMYYNIQIQLSLWSHRPCHDGLLLFRIILSLNH